MTFICELDPYSLEIYQMYENELHVSKVSKVIVLQRDRHDRLYTVPLHGWSASLRILFVSAKSQRKGIIMQRSNYT